MCTLRSCATLSFLFFLPHCRSQHSLSWPPLLAGKPGAGPRVLPSLAEAGSSHGGVRLGQRGEPLEGRPYEWALIRQ